MDFHDATLLGLDLSWDTGTAVVRLRVVGQHDVVRVVAEGVTDVHLPRLQPWGPSVSVNSLSITATDVAIEMQSGDTIKISAAAFAVEPLGPLSELRAAERALAVALGADDPLAWVDHYTDDAYFVGPGAPPVIGRAALLEMAAAMHPLRSVSIDPAHTDLNGDLAAVYSRASWVVGEGTPDRVVSRVRGLIVWRRESGRWRVAQEVLQPDPD